MKRWRITYRRQAQRGVARRYCFGEAELRRTLAHYEADPRVEILAVEEIQPQGKGWR